MGHLQYMLAKERAYMYICIRMTDLFCYTVETIMEKAMAPHSSTLAWKIPWTEEPGRLQSMGSRRVGHDWVPSLSLFTFMHWRWKWQPTPGESQGWEPGGLPSMGSHRVGHDWGDLAAVWGITEYWNKCEIFSSWKKWTCVLLNVLDINNDWEQVKKCL